MASRVMPSKATTTLAMDITNDMVCIIIDQKVETTLLQYVSFS